MDQAASRARLQAAAAAAAASEAAAAAAAPSEAAETAEAAAEPVHSRAAGPAFGGGSSGGGGGTFGGAAVWGQGLRWSPSPSLGSNRSPDEERELLEWFGGTVEQRKAGGGDFGPAAAAGEQQLALPGLSGAAESSAAAGLGQQQGLAGAAPGRQLLHPQQQLQPGPGAAMLPCPHCGTPTPSTSGALTVVCPKCRACFLNLPPSTLMLGASLFLRKAGQGQRQGQGHDQSRGQSGQLPPAPAGSTSDGAVPTAESPAVAGTAAVASPASGATASSLTRPGQAGPGGRQDAPAGADTRPVVEAADVLAVVAEAAGVPLSHVSRTDWESQLTLETSLLQQVRRERAVAHVRTCVRALRLHLQLHRLRCSDRAAADSQSGAALESPPKLRRSRPGQSALAPVPRARCRAGGGSGRCCAHGGGCRAAGAAGAAARPPPAGVLRPLRAARGGAKDLVQGMCPKDACEWVTVSANLPVSNLQITPGVFFPQTC